jgi:DNA-directed RNA polymerase subunit K/omega
MPVDRSKLPNAFEFVSVAGARARQLLDGCTPRVEAGTDKAARIAEREVLAGTVSAVAPAAPTPVAPDPPADPGDEQA